jgi:ADP-heptose:LPS heptosyltransferase
MMTCAVRDLHRLYPGQFVTGVVTPTPDIWLNNPYVTRVDRRAAEHLKVGYSRSIQESNQRGAHFASGFVQHLSELLGIRIRLTELKPDVHLTPAELESQVGGLSGDFVLLNAGGKSDFTAKIWEHAKWQKVVDLLRDSLQVVQVGGATHLHRPLTGCTDLLGKTTFRQLMVLTAQARASACGVTALMHLAAAVNRPCVVVAGGREPWWWEAYTRPTWENNAVFPVPSEFRPHTFLHTIGQLKCCQEGGCWRSGIGEKKGGNNCSKVEQVPDQLQPKCLTSIEPEQVASAILAHLEGKPEVTEMVPIRLKSPLFTEALPVSPARTAPGGSSRRPPRWSTGWRPRVSRR